MKPISTPGPSGSLQQEWGTPLLIAGRTGNDSHMKRNAIMIKRILIASFILQSLSLSGQKPNAPSCQVQGGGHTEDWYYQAVWDRIWPPDKPQSLIVIKLSDYFDTKIVLRKRDKATFELLRLSSSESIFSILNDLDQSCRLPSSPTDAVKLLQVRWKKIEISHAQFEKLHREFTTSLSDYVLDIRRRYGSDERIIIFHGKEYDISYDNDGYEHIEVVVNDGSDRSGSAFPLSNWAREVLALSEKTTSGPAPSN